VAAAVKDPEPLAAVVELIPAVVVVMAVLVVPLCLVIIVTVAVVVEPVDTLATAELVEDVVLGVPRLVIPEPVVAADQVVIMVLAEPVVVVE
jgi:hypothetical protein